MEQLEDYIINPLTKKNIIESAEQQMEGLNRALSVLKAEDLPTNLPVLKKILSSEDGFHNWLDEAKKSYIGKLGFIPRNERRRIETSFADLEQRIATPINTISVILKSAKYTVKERKDGNWFFDPEEIESDATERSKRFFSEEDKEYYQKILSVREALKSLSEWEEEHFYFHLQDHPCFMSFLTGESLKPAFYQVIGLTLGKMNPKAVEMLREQEDVD